MNLVICFSSTDDTKRLALRLHASTGSLTVHSADTVTDAFNAIKNLRIDVLLVDVAMMERALAARRAYALNARLNTKQVLASSSPPPPLLVKAAQYGFDDVVDPMINPGVLIEQLREIATDRRSIHINPSLKSVDLIPGLFTRSIACRDDTDGDIVELLSLGLSDKDIASVLNLSNQTIRNRISHLLLSHGLSSRTQLATLHIRNESLARTLW